MTRYRDLVTQDLRLTVLHLLTQADGYDLNSSILASALREFGHRPSMDRLEMELGWLAERGLITIVKVGHLTVSKLTLRGEDVAYGHAVVPGVKRPGPQHG